MPRDESSNAEATRFQLEGPLGSDTAAQSLLQKVLDALSRGWRRVLPVKGSYEPLEEDTEGMS